MTAYRLDHMAIAVPRWEETGRYLTEQWGARWKHGFTGVPQFHPAQLSLRDTRRVELLEPDGDDSSFVQRFLAAAGMQPRVHHITFYVPDVEEAISRIREIGLTPQQIRVDNDLWREAFVYPKDSGLGFLTQVVEVHGDPAAAPDGGPSPFLAPIPPWAVTAGQADDEPAGFEHIIGRVHDLAHARRLLVDVLGAVEHDVAGASATVRNFVWSEGPSIVLEESPSDRPGITAVALSRDGNARESVGRAVAQAQQAPQVKELGVRVVLV